MTPGDATQVQAAIEDAVRAEMATRLKRLGATIAADLKREVSVPCPVPYGQPGYIPATPGAPPRRDTGRGRASIVWKVNSDALELRVGNYLGPFNYMQYHEDNQHPWFWPVWRRNYAKYCAILGVTNIAITVTPT